MKKLQKLVLKEVAPVLEKAGFVRAEGLSFVRRIHGERELHVDIQDLKYRPAFSINLQDLSWDGKHARARSLERLVGLPHYAYEPDDELSFQRAVELAATHLETVGLVWLSDPTFETEHTKAVKAAADVRRYDDLVSRAKVAFKESRYEDALVLFSAAAAVQRLDPLSEKYRSIATERISSKRD
jgi:hypothetical protein